MGGNRQETDPLLSFGPGSFVRPSREREGSEIGPSPSSDPWQSVVSWRRSDLVNGNREGGCREGIQEDESKFAGSALHNRDIELG